MVNINVTVTTAKELKAIIEELQKAGMIDASKPKEVISFAEVEPANPGQMAFNSLVEAANLPLPFAAPAAAPIPAPPIAFPQMSAVATPYPAAGPVPTSIFTPAAPIPAQVPIPVQVPPIPAQANPEKNYTLDEISLAASRQLCNIGRQQEVINLLTAFGVRALTELPKESYNAFADGLKNLGVKL